MYAKYNYLTTGLLGDVVNDVVAILAGETNTANLSAACDTGNTTISNAIANAGWAVHDPCANTSGVNCAFTNQTDNIKAASAPTGVNAFAVGQKVMLAGTGTPSTGVSKDTLYYIVVVTSTTEIKVSATRGGTAISITASTGSGTVTIYNGNKQVLKAAVVDDAAFYKYAQLDVSSAASIQLHLFESWDATTHTGTNQASSFAATAQQQLTIGSGTPSLLIGASARYIMMQSSIAAGIGSSTGNAWTGIFERSRLAPWDTVAAGYPPSIMTGGGAFGYSAINSSAPRIKNPAGGDFTTTNARVYACAMGWTGDSAQVTNSGIGTGVSGSSSAIKTKVPDGIGGFYTPFTEIHFRKAALNTSFEGGSISSICDVWSTVSYPNNLDEVTKGSTTYVIWQNSALATATTQTGGTYDCSANTALPKG